MIKTFVFILFIALSQTGCKEQSTTSPTKVHWDRDMCSRCVMVVSDRHNTVQVKDPKTGKSFMFDDLGCTILWLKDKEPTWKDNAIIWITDVTTGKWIDARKAFYDSKNITPMAYGFSAHTTKESIKNGKEIIDFTEVSRRVIKIGK